MKAAVYTEYGGPHVLQIKELPKPQPRDNEVLVKVHAVSINDWDWGLLQSDVVNRLMFGLFKPGKQILGSDIAGRIESVGKDVTKFRPGDEVFGDLSGQWGGLAEYVCAPEKLLALKSPKMSFAEAAAIPQAAMLAVQGLIDKGNIHKGQKLLINGAGGGVGTFGVQIARSLGVDDITVVDTAGKLDMLRSMGATHTIDYRKEDFTKNGRRYDLILDVRTNRPISDYVRALNPNGKYVTVGGSMRRILQVVILGPWIRKFRKRHVTLVALKPNKDLVYMNELFESGKMKPVIDPHEFKLEDVREAFGFFGSAEHMGKVIINI